MGDFILSVKINYNLSHERVYAVLPQALLLDEEQVILEAAVEGSHWTLGGIGAHRRDSLLLGRHTVILVYNVDSLHLGHLVHVTKEGLVLTKCQILGPDFTEIVSVVVPIGEYLGGLGQGKTCRS